MEGEKLGKYEVRRTLGRGAMGVVYEGWDPQIARKVAIKTVALAAEQDAEAREALARFQREAQAAGRLQHPNIVGVFDYGETATLAYIVMEFVDGESLKAVLDRGERFPLSETMRIMEELLKGLGFSHERGVVHRDIKPANIMLTREGGVKIADFGIARIESSSMTQAGTVLGTPSYMSPEQFKGEPVDARTDIYSTGVVLYQLLTGEKPFEGSVSAIMHKVLTTTPPKPSELAVTAPPPFDAVVAKAMAKRPEERFATAASFAQAIRAAPAGAIAAAAAEEEGTIVASGAAPPGATPGATRGATPGAARTSTFAPLVATAPHRRPLPIWIGAVVILILVIGGGLWLFAFRVAQGPKSELVAAGGSASSPRAAIAAAEAPAPAPAAPPKGTPTPAAPAAPTAPASSPAPQAHPARHEAASAAASPAPASPLPSTAGVTTQPAAPANPTAPTTATPPPAPASTASTVAPGAAPGAAPLPVPPPPEPPPEPPPSAAAAPSTPAPAPVAPAPAPTKVANIAASPEAIAKSVAAAIAPVSCSLVSGSVATAETITLTGLAGNQAPAQLHQVLADAAPSAAVNWNVTTFSGGAAATYCRALNLLRPIATPFGAAQQGLQLALESGRTVLADGDPIAFRVAMPSYHAWLSVDYFSSDGSVAHLMPGPGNPARLRSSDKVVLVHGQPPWTAGPPYGRDMIVAIASAKPLFDTPRPESEKASAYLPALAAALDAARGAGTHLDATALLLETHAKH